MQFKTITRKCKKILSSLRKEKKNMDYKYDSNTGELNTSLSSDSWISSGIISSKTVTVPLDTSDPSIYQLGTGYIYPSIIYRDPPYFQFEPNPPKLEPEKPKDTRLTEWLKSESNESASSTESFSTKDLVQLKSGGPVMFIKSIKENLVTCRWINEKRETNLHTFHKSQLNKVATIKDCECK